MILEFRKVLEDSGDAPRSTYPPFPFSPTMHPSSHSILGITGSGMQFLGPILVYCSYVASHRQCKYIQREMRLRSYILGWNYEQNRSKNFAILRRQYRQTVCFHEMFFTFLATSKLLWDIFFFVELRCEILFIWFKILGFGISGVSVRLFYHRFIRCNPISASPSAFLASAN